MNKLLQNKPSQGVAEQRHMHTRPSDALNIVQNAAMKDHEDTLTEMSVASLMPTNAFFTALSGELTPTVPSLRLTACTEVQLVRSLVVTEKSIYIYAA
jgi:hypothetical protein